MTMTPGLIEQALEDMHEHVQKRIYDTAFEHGWWEEDRTFGDIIALMHSELSEALEHFRDGDNMHEIKFMHATNCRLFGQYTDVATPGWHGCSCIPKPDGVAVELADVIIRILDAAQGKDIPVLQAIAIKMAYNDTRPYRHGGKAL